MHLIQDQKGELSKQKVELEEKELERATARADVLR